MKRLIVLVCCALVVSAGCGTAGNVPAGKETGTAPAAKPVAAPAAAPAAKPAAAPAAKPAAAPAVALAATQTNLNLFEGSVAWNSAGVNGDGSFVLGKDGAKPIGIMNFDFSGAASGDGGRYVLANTAVSIPDTVGEVRISARASGKQNIALQLADETGQTHQFKAEIEGTGKWETVKIALTKDMEHWGGANDGVFHFPIKNLVIITGMPVDSKTTGKVEFADVQTTAKLSAEGQKK